jgi:hypothetical protein
MHWLVDIHNVKLFPLAEQLGKSFLDARTGVH